VPTFNVIVLSDGLHENAPALRGPYSAADPCVCSFFLFSICFGNWIYKSRVALLEQINVLRHQVFVALNSHKSSLFLCDLVIYFIDVRFLFQYAVGLGLRGCHSNVRLGRSRSARLITKSVYTGVSE